MTKWTEENIQDLSAKTIIITGANSGIGFESTKMLAAKGAHVIMACRSLERGNIAKNLVLEETKDASIDVVELDLNDFHSIDNFVQTVQKNYKHIDILLNNAGIMATPYGKTMNGLEQQIGVNHFGHFNLTMQLLPLLSKGTNPRIVNVASIAHRFGSYQPSLHVYEPNRRYSKSITYANSKIANLLFTNELQDRLENLGSNIIVLAAHPGIATTNLGRHSKSIKLPVIRHIIGLFNQDAYHGALPLVRACVDETLSPKDFVGPHGFYQMKGYPVVVSSKSKAKRKDWMTGLFEDSIRLTKKDITI